MKHSFSVLLILLNSVFSYSQPDEQAALKKVLDGFLLAIKNNDAAAAGKLLADDYKIYGGFYCIKNKELRIASLKAGQIKYELKNNDAAKKFTVNEYGANIELYAPLRYTACNQDGKELTIENCPVLLHFVKQEGNWRILGECLGGSCLH